MSNDHSKDAAVDKFIADSYQGVGLIAHHEECERVEFEKYMMEHFIIGTEVEKKLLLVRLPSHPRIYNYTLIEDAWVIWKARAAISRGERPEPPILYSSLTK